MAIEAYALQIGATLGAAWVQNTLHYLADNATDSPSWEMALALTDEWDAQIKGLWLDTLPSAYILRWIEAKKISSGGGKSWPVEYPNATTFGTLGSTVANTNQAPIVKLFPALGTNTQGRIYMPGISEHQLVDNVIGNDYKAAINDLMPALKELTGGFVDWTLGIHSKKLAATVPVVDIGLSQYLGNIGRRRKPA